MVGWICIFLNHRNEYIEFLFILNLLAYPLWDMLFTITRRIINSKNFMRPDSLHLHSILAKLIERKTMPYEKK